MGNTGKPTMTAATQVSLSGRVYQHLKTQLSVNHFPIGAPLNASQIADSLGVSHTTVNKAISQLIDSGWVTQGQGRHPVVVSLPPKSSTEDVTSEFKHVNRTDTTYRAILERVIRSEFPPGDIIKAKPLAEKLNVSFSTVRQALEWLCSDGLFVRLPRRGWQVIKLSTKDVRDIYDIRLLLEPMAISRAIHQMETSDIEELLEETQVMISEDESSSDYDHRQHDYRFHRAILDASGSQVFVETLDPLLRKLMLTIVSGGLSNSVTYGQHYEVLKAFADRDEEKAIEAMKTHLTVASQTLLQQLEDSN